jgi:hypothetical protein
VATPVSTFATRTLDDRSGVIDISGDLTAARETSLMEAYTGAGGAP